MVKVKPWYSEFLWSPWQHSSQIHAEFDGYNEFGYNK